ncbi:MULTISPECIES: Pvc16 family protein [Rhodococcus]|uniref:Pvc16 N-terminal domain-containing protein n=1 Tax=Rhodococcus opacus RKJ300 = JCM 13270 TaxID=1165867 RepID=I0WDM6_RHOOP|nr:MULTISPECIES: Pvc16 family protein [Rhodococcus]EID74492.1 hypothetical protein W59_29954 [Rhodococcus opacus RKJ300 = JCM 13270]QQZ18458.1 DUF4255 domain-containing protein [Rhodococcus sp. 21391]
MATFTAIYDAVRSVVALLDRHITQSSETLLATVPVTAVSPRELEINSVQTAVSVWLHRVDLQPDLLNSPAPRPESERELHRPTPVELLLYVTPLDPDGPTRAALLGRVVQVLADHRRLAGAALLGGLAGSSTPLLLSMDTLTQYDLSLLWGALHTHQRAGVALRVNGLVIDTHLAPRDSSRVLKAETQVDQIAGAGVPA